MGVPRLVLHICVGVYTDTNVCIHVCINVCIYMHIKECVCVIKVTIIRIAVCHDYQIFLQKFAIRAGRYEEMNAQLLYRLSKGNV